jgi:GNAT superfamily N-acetyltransferase
VSGPRRATALPGRDRALGGVGGHVGAPHGDGRAFASQTPVQPPPGALRETPASILEHLARGGGAVAELDGALVGAVLWEAQEGALDFGRLSVDPACRRRGIARALIEAAEREARRQGLPRLTLGVRLALPDNRRLFASCGFVETTRHRHEGFREPRRWSARSTEQR